MAESWLIITGAGASRELGQTELMPLMADWRVSLRQQLDKNAPGAASALGLAGPCADDPGIDFEKRIGEFLAWRRSLPTIKPLLRLGMPNFDDPSPDLSKWFLQNEHRAEQLLGEIHRSLYDNFDILRVSTVAAEKAYRGLIRDTLGITEDASLIVATTNYDPSAEIGLFGLGRRPYWGEDSAHYGTRPVHTSDLLSQVPSRTPILYLHGRVGWYRQSGEVVAHDLRQPFNDTLEPALLLPDPNKSYKDDRVVGEIWRAFEVALKSASRVLILGHSLHDDELVNMIRSHARSEHVAITACFEAGSNPEDVYKEFERLQELVPGSHFVRGRFGPDSAIEDGALAKWIEGQGRIVPPPAHPPAM